MTERDSIIAYVEQRAVRMREVDRDAALLLEALTGELRAEFDKADPVAK